MRRSVKNLRLKYAMKAVLPPGLGVNANYIKFGDKFTRDDGDPAYGYSVLNAGTGEVLKDSIRSAQEAEKWARVLTNYAASLFSPEEDQIRKLLPRELYEAPSYAAADWLEERGKTREAQRLLQISKRKHMRREQT